MKSPTKTTHIATDIIPEGIDPRDCKPGLGVKYYPVVNKNEFTVTEVVSRPWQLGSKEWVCKINGISGVVWLKALEEIK